MRRFVIHFGQSSRMRRVREEKITTEGTEKEGGWK